MSFRLVSLQPSADKNGMWNDKIYAKKGEIKTMERTKAKYKCVKQWLLFEKNTILVWNWLRIIVSMLGSRGVPSLQSFSNAKRVIKIYAMVEWPRMFRNVRTISISFDIPDVFFLASFKTPAGFAYITPITISTGYFTNHIELMFDRWSEFGRRKFLL